ncbi:UNVERIFIED_CONTAM: hypothetical protein H355_012868 [Colinus virginianus]|nr:hypothetical protein H355_012868 [Colinus virginianus]
MLPHQRPLLRDRIEKINSTLAPGLAELKWRDSEAVDSFISQAKNVVTEVYCICDTMKTNLQKAIGVLGAWAEKPLFERKPKAVSPDDLDQMHKASISLRHHVMAEEGKELQKILRDSADALKTSKGTPQWRLHVDFVNALVIQGFVAVIVIYLRHLCKFLEAVKLELIDNSIGLVPAFGHDKARPGYREIPPLSRFDEEISYFQKVRQEISNFKTPVDICWIRVNAQPAKIQLNQLAAKWANQYINFLHDFCAARIDGVTGFINKMLECLSEDIPTEEDENQESLYSVMTHIRDVKIAIEAIKTLFIPIREQDEDRQQEEQQEIVESVSGCCRDVRSHIQASSNRNSGTFRVPQQQQEKQQESGQQ